MYPPWKARPAAPFKNDELVVYLLGALAVTLFILSIWQYLVGGLAIIGAASLYREFNRPQPTY